MKLSSLNIGKAIQEGVWIDILLPADVEGVGAEGEPSGLRVKVRSVDSAAYREAVERVYRDRVKKKTQQQPTMDETERKAVDILVAITVDWDGFKDDDEQPLKRTDENVRQVYLDDGYRWIRDQVDRGANERRRFFMG